MSLEAPMLAAAVIQALVGMPTAFKELKGFLRKDRPDTVGALQCIDTLVDALTQFCQMEGWLSEAKEFHTGLTILDERFSGIDREYYHATEGGNFNGQEYRMKKVREYWNDIRQQSLPRFLAFAKNLKYIELSPLVLNNENKPLSGPAWALRLMVLKDQIEQAIEEWDNRTNVDTAVIAELFNQMINLIRSSMLSADERIRDESFEFAKRLIELRSSLNMLRNG